MSILDITLKSNRFSNTYQKASSLDHLRNFCALGKTVARVLPMRTCPIFRNSDSSRDTRSGVSQNRESGELLTSSARSHPRSATIEMNQHYVLNFMLLRDEFRMFRDGVTPSNKMTGTFLGEHWLSSLDPAMFDGPGTTEARTHLSVQRPNAKSKPPASWLLENEKLVGVQVTVVPSTRSSISKRT